MTVTGVPVRRALVAKGFRGRPSLWVIFPKILCGVLGVRRTGENSIHRVRTNVWITSHHVQLVMSCHVGVKSWWRLVPRVPNESSSCRAALRCIGLSLLSRQPCARMARHVEAGRGSAYPSTTRLGRLPTSHHLDVPSGCWSQHRRRWIINRRWAGRSLLSSLIARNGRAVCLIATFAVKVPRGLAARHTNISKGETKIADAMSPCPASLASVSEKYSLFAAGS